MSNVIEMSDFRRAREAKNLQVTVEQTAEQNRKAAISAFEEMGVLLVPMKQVGKSLTEVL